MRPCEALYLTYPLVKIWSVSQCIRPSQGIKKPSLTPSTSLSLSFTSPCLDRKDGEREAMGGADDDVVDDEDESLLGLLESASLG